MGSFDHPQASNMKAFLCISALVVAAYGAPQILAGHGLVGHGVVGHGVVGYHAVVGVSAGQTSHQSVSKPYQGEHRSTVQSKAFGSPVAAVSDHTNIAHGRRVAGVVGHGVVGHGVVGHGLVGHGVVAHAAPLVHAAPAYHAPVVAHAVAHPVAEVYADE